jgi:hypothetical protein
MSFSQYLNQLLNEVSQSTLDKVADNFITKGNEPSIVKDYLNRFNQLTLKQRLKGIDITQFKSFDELKKLVDDTEATKSKTEIKREISDKDVEKVYENSQFLIISPKTHEASCKYGAGTKWCISAKNTVDNWNFYNKRLIKFYFIFDKAKFQNDPYYKVAISVYLDGTMEAFDATDHHINPEWYINKMGLNINLFKPKERNEEDYLNSIIEGTWKKNPDGTIDVDGTVGLSQKNLTKIPFKFNKVSKDFYCNKNKLITLEGSPKEIGGSFLCDNNLLTTLEGSPKEVGEHFNCSNNKLTSLKGSPKEIGGSFHCGNNLLTTLEGSPKEIGGNFYYIPNKNKFTVEDVRKVSNVRGDIKLKI